MKKRSTRRTDFGRRFFNMHAGRVIPLRIVPADLRNIPVTVGFAAPGKPAAP